jgi:hypothetical protein
MARSSEASLYALETAERTGEPSLYDRDVYTWSSQQAGLIRAGRLTEVDWENVAEEIDSLGRSERSSLQSFLALVIQHMLKWDYQPEKRTRSWIVSMNTHRAHVRRRLRLSPGLKAQLPDLVEEAYGFAVDLVEAETGIPTDDLPTRSPYGVAEILEREFSVSDLGGAEGGR